MAFAVRNLSVLAYANGFTLWHYKAGSDGLDAVGIQNYFENASDMLSHGDIMMVSAMDGAQIVCVSADREGSVSTAAIC